MLSCTFEDISEKQSFGRGRLQAYLMSARRANIIEEIFKDRVQGIIFVQDIDADVYHI